MKRARFVIFALVLTGGVVAAVSSLVAQTPNQEPAERRARVMMLDGRGAQLGVTVSDLSAEELKRDTSGGVRIDDVDQDSPAAKAGLREGDIVVEYDGERVRSSRQFSRLVQETPDGRTVKLALMRDGTRQTVDVTPEASGFAWGVDTDRIGRDVARSMRELEPRLKEQQERLKELEPRLRALEPRLREFRFDGPAFNFDFPGLMTPRSRLGVQIDDLNPQLAEYFGAKDGGVLVSSVTENSAAQKAGLKAGDVITAINGTRVRDYDDLRERLREASGEITVGILRDKKEMTVKATIEETRTRTRRSGRPI